ncbi:MAG: tRNA lysidine(34) synthetase TilS [Pseudorhodobacter sp.]|nr:tRNA lysidine(34) synthetase TilS [Pseudorhodobacter sp.]
MADPAAAIPATLEAAVLAAVPGNATLRLGVAVSGGSDSMALMQVAAGVARQRRWDLQAVTVDHALRAEAADEAAMVGQVARSLGLEHAVLRWSHGAIGGNLQDQARRARYELLADWAARQSISTVLLGHTADDQAETLLMGLARGAGLEGLCGMRPAWRQGGAVFARPFLDVPRADLRAFLQARGVGWVDDPSNSNPKFTRVRARQVLKALQGLAITPAQLAGTARHLARAQSALESAAAEACAALCQIRAGAVVVERDGFAATEPELARRIVLAALRWISGAEYAPRAASVARFQEAMTKGRSATLWGCRLRRRGDQLWITREAAALGGACPATEIWDGRWRMEGPFAPGQTIAALGPAGLARCPAWRDTGLSRDALVVSPAIWYDDLLIAAPLAGFSEGWKARIVAGEALFPVSH